MNKQIAILITTFKRDPLLKSCIANNLKNLPDNTIILIGDQDFNNEKITYYSKFENVIYFPLMFDCGLSSSRNRLVLEAKKLNIPYCLLMADSQWFNSKPDLSKIISFLESDTNNGIVGLKLNNLDGTNLPWEFDIELVQGKHFLMKLPKRPIVQFEGAKFQPCDVIKNFFLAKTQCLLDSPWSDELKLLEHEDFFYKLSQSKWKVFYNDSIIADRVKDRGIAYDKYRKRAYSEFAKKLRAKYHILGWIKKG